VSPNATRVFPISFARATPLKIMARDVFWCADMSREQQGQKDLVRDQFTRTAQVFGDYAIATRVSEAERLARMVRAGSGECVVDLACGPGTLALRFARQVRWVCGLDLTPAMLNRARDSARNEGLGNLEFALADAEALPLADGSFDIAVTSYSLHHMSDPAGAVAEMRRVAKRGGRVGVLDIFVPEDPRVAACNNRIERVRDRSHTSTLPRSEFERLFAAMGLRILETYVEAQARSFDEWMLVAGSKPGDARYQEARHLLEQSIPDDSAWFHPRLVPSGDAGQNRELVLENTLLFVSGEKI
jgi:ubiquinone/menaquinone biosynthesis C-methylase UbiE